jgi:hypothetical protein
MSAGEGFDQAPDGIVPLVGYRLWWVQHEDEEPAFLPLNHPTADWSGATRGWVSASCSVVPELLVFPGDELVESAITPHRVPGEDCRCGFYAMKELHPQLLRAVSMQTASMPTPTEGRLVVGRVELAGKIVEHDLGYRAERARIVELIPIRGEEGAVEAIARRAAVAVGRPVRAPRTPIPDRVRYLRFAWAASKAEPRGERKSGHFPLFVLWGCWMAFRVWTLLQEVGAGP